MKHSFVKMINRISEIENYILKGLVLDGHGNWIPIVEKKAVEDDFLAHLSAGQVLHEGRWVNFAEAKKIRLPTTARRSGTKTKKKAEAALPDTALLAESPAAEEETRIGQSSTLPPGISGEAAPYPPETSVVTEAAFPEEETPTGHAPATSPAQSGGDELFPPETSIILETLAAEEETRIGRSPHEPPPSDVMVSNDDFAPETKILYITPPGQQEPEPGAPAMRETDVYPVEASGNTQEIPSAGVLRPKRDEDDTRIFFKPSVPTWDDRGDKRKKALMFIGGAVVVIAGIAAIIIIIMQAPK